MAQLFSCFLRPFSVLGIFSEGFGLDAHGCEDFIALSDAIPLGIIGWRLAVGPFSLPALLQVSSARFSALDWFRDTNPLQPNKSLQPTRSDALGLSRSRGLFCIAVPAWLSSSR